MEKLNIEIPDSELDAFESDGVNLDLTNDTSQRLDNRPDTLSPAEGFAWMKNDLELKPYGAKNSDNV
jgi:hypothetical protein